MTLRLGQEQEKAFTELKRWWSSPYKEPFILSGYAGTGKTTLAKIVAEDIVGDPEHVCFAAYTGKAALQLRKKGCDKATTLHKLLYRPLEKDRARLLELSTYLQKLLVEDPQVEKPETIRVKTDLLSERRRVSTPSWENDPGVPPGTRLIVVDESSMVDTRIFEDLTSLGVRVLFLGDPFQLPPVFGTSPVSSKKPNFVLTEVHRQALDNPVLRAATLIRDGQSPRAAHQDGGLFQIIDFPDATYELYASHDQVLCGRNLTRRNLNNKMRKRLVETGVIAGSTLQLAKNDRIVFLRNDHDESVYNGTTGTVSSVVSGDDGLLMVDCTDEDLDIYAYPVWPGILDDYDITEAPRRTQVVDLAYALTVHKAQGSEWDSVLVQDEPFGAGDTQLRWLYTAVTRARTRCTIVTRRHI